MEFIPLLTLILVIALCVVFAIMIKKYNKIQALDRENPILRELENRISALDNKITTLDSNHRSDFSNNRSEIDKKINALSNSLINSNNDFRKELSSNLKNSTNELSNLLKENLKENAENLTANIDRFNNTQKENFKTIRELFEATKDNINKALLSIRDSVDKQLKEIQENNAKKLEEMRVVVDEKLHKTLEERLGHSFKQVSERLESVYKKIGEIEGIASSVGDLKKVLTNVKTAGNLGEYQLSTILFEMLSADLYFEQVKIKENSNEKVDFAIKLPNKNDSANAKEYILLPIDSKFPITIYESLLNAYESNDKDIITNAQKALKASIIKSAQEIQSKYIYEPITTNFAIMFLPFEGLYAEVLRIPNLLIELQEKYKITLASPTTIVAFINSLQMGFKTLAIQKKSGEIFDTLGKAKTEFSKFAEQIDKVKKNITEAGNNLEKIGVRSRAVERSLKNVEKIDFSDEEDPFKENLLEA